MQKINKVFPTLLLMLLLAASTGCGTTEVLELSEMDADAGTETPVWTEPSDDGTDSLSSSHSTAPEQFDDATIVRVVDGDTVVCDGTDYGDDVKVRLIGVNTPESVHSDASKNTQEGVEASNWTKAALPAGTNVYLEYDEETTDKYGRLLAYLWLSNQVDTTNYADFLQYNFGALLLENTYCEAVYYAPNGKYRSWYEKLDAA